jgi:hypothetical protein
MGVKWSVGKRTTFKSCNGGKARPSEVTNKLNTAALQKRDLYRTMVCFISSYIAAPSTQVLETSHVHMPFWYCMRRKLAYSPSWANFKIRAWHSFIRASPENAVRQCSFVPHHHVFSTTHHSHLYSDMYLQSQAKLSGLPTVLPSACVIAYRGGVVGKYHELDMLVSGPDLPFGGRILKVSTGLKSSCRDKKVIRRSVGAACWNLAATAYNIVRWVA